MTIALFGPDAGVLDEVAASLNGEEVETCPFALSAAARMRALGNAFHKAVLIFLKHGAGEPTGNVKKLVGDNRDLILCTNLPVAADREMLAQIGAARIITPRSSAPKHVAERILAQLILDGEVQPGSCGNLLGATSIMRRVYEQIARYSPFSDPVLILGETGTGKELVAKEIHRLSVGKSGRQDKFLPLNCSVLERGLAASELFGHKKGAFTGAVAERPGMIAAAGHGTFMLDEIGELDLQVQANLLRVLEDNEVKPVGSNEYIKVHARILLATHRDLERECQEGGFRRDLFRRIQGFRIELPPLRKRRADIPLLARHFLSKWNSEYGKRLQIPDGAFDCLFNDDWAEGNLRDLCSAVRQAAAYADSTGSEYVYPSTVTSEFGRKLNQKGFTINCDPSTEIWKEFLDRAQARYFSSLLEMTGGSRTQAIPLSGLHRSQFYEKIKELDPSEE